MMYTSKATVSSPFALLLGDQLLVRTCFSIFFLDGDGFSLLKGTRLLSEVVDKSVINI